MEESIQAHKDQLRDKARRRWKESGAAIRALRKARWDALTPKEQAEKKSAQKTRLQRWRLANRGYHTDYLRTYRETPEGREVFRRATKRQRAKRLHLLHALKDVPCDDCELKFPSEVMEFDHRDPSEKTFSISTFGRRVGEEALLEEVAKCDVVCANCHRVRTVNRRNGLTNGADFDTLES